MKRYEMVKYFTTFCRAIVEAENEDDAIKLFMDVDIDSCDQESTCSEFDRVWVLDKGEDSYLPVIRATDDGYEVVDE